MLEIVDGVPDAFALCFVHQVSAQATVIDESWANKAILAPLVGGASYLLFVI